MINLKIMFLIFGTMMIVFVASLILYDQWEKEPTKILLEPGNSIVSTPFSSDDEGFHGFAISDPHGNVKHYPIHDLASMPCDDFLESATFPFNIYPKESNILELKLASCKYIVSSPKIPQIDMNVESCIALMDKNRSGIVLDKEQRAEMRDGLDKCQDDASHAREFSKIVYENCEQLWEDYDGKIGIIVHSMPVQDWLKQELKYCKDDSHALKKVLNYCEAAKKGGIMPTIPYQFENNTHYIDNNDCEWILGPFEDLDEYIEEEYDQDFGIDYTEKFE